MNRKTSNAQFLLTEIMYIGESGPSGEKMTTSAAKRKQHLETSAKEGPVSKKAKTAARGQYLSRDMVVKEDKPKQDTVDMKVVCPMPRASEKKTLLMRKFVQEKCIMNNEVGTHSVKWSPEIELSNYKDSAYEKKIFQANFKLCMTNDRGDIVDDYSFGEFPVNTTYSMRKGVEKKDNDTKLDIDHATFSMLVSEGRKLCHFVDRNLRGKTFNSEEEMGLPEMISLDTKEAGNGNKVHILLALSIYKWGKRGGNKFQPFFNIRRFIEDTDGKLTPTVRGLTLNFREMHNLVFSASEYLNVMVDQFAKPKLVHDKMKIVLGEKIKGFMKKNPDVNTEKLDFLLDSDDQHETESDDEEDFSDLQIESDLKEISDSDNDNEIPEAAHNLDDITDADFL
jgi:hypothetical protein